MKLRRTPAEQIAFDSGAARRCITHQRLNPYDIAATPGLHVAWEEGWEKTDAEINRVTTR